MALLLSHAIASTPNLRIKLFQDQLVQLQQFSALHLPHRKFCTRTYSMKASMTMRDHNEPNEVKLQIRIMSEKLKEAMPISVQEFPWKKAEGILIDRLLFLAQEAFKWSLISFFIFSSLSDIVYTLSVNHELLFPVGLFVGCLMADFLKEISWELFPSSQDKVLNRRHLGMYCFFVFVKFMSMYFTIQARVFLLHIANGGLMQVLWFWRSLVNDTNKGSSSSVAS